MTTATRRYARATTGLVAIAAATVAGLGSSRTLAATTTPSGTLPAGYVIVGGSFSAPIGLQSFGSVTCPSTGRGTPRYPMSGGVLIDSNSVYANINSSRPSGRSWQGWVDNDTASAFTFEVYGVCALRKTGYTVATSAAQDNPPTTQSRYTEPCPRGTRILGGGTLGSSTSIGDSMNSSYPSGNGWHVDFNNATPDDQSFTVYAVCSQYSLTTGYKVVTGSPVDNAPGAQSVAEAFCPTNTAALGGGVFSSSSSTQVNINVTDPSSGAWVNRENNADTSDHSITPYVICAG
jgi:hypothetical protein